MPKPFYERLKKYYEDVGSVLRGEADSGSILPNTSDVGVTRERVYLEFLKSHLPSLCNTVLGGFVFGEDGSESKQIDVIITSNVAPKFDHINKDGTGKSFTCVEGCLGVASIKSNLDKKELIDSLIGIASIPSVVPLNGRANPLLPIKNYEDWPFKIIYASSGLKPDTIFNHLLTFYQENPDIPESRRPNIVHVAGNCLILKLDETVSAKMLRLGKPGEYVIVKTNVDVQALMWTVDRIQKRCIYSREINFHYPFIINSIAGLL